MDKYIIVVSVYDSENTQAYPLGGIFNTREDAVDYIKVHLKEIKKDHWTKGCVNGADYYREEFSIDGSFHAEDTSCGESLDITIFEVPFMFDMYVVPKDYVNFYLEDTQQWCSTLGEEGGEAAIFTKEQAEALVASERKKYKLHGTAGPYAIKLVPIQKQLVE